MNAITRRKLKGKIRKNIWRKKRFRYEINARAWCRKEILKMPESAALDYIYYIAHDFLYSFFYMMTYKKFLHYGVYDYHRIWELLFLFKYHRVSDMDNLVRSLFYDIDSDEELLRIMNHLGFETLVLGDTVYVLTEESSDIFNPNAEPFSEVHYFSTTIVENFWCFRQLFYDAVKAFVECHPDREKYLNIDLWLYACCYLLMGKGSYFIDGFGPDGRNFPYKMSDVTGNLEFWSNIENAKPTLYLKCLLQKRQ